MDAGLVDAGPLVAILDRRDIHHEACSLAAQRFRKPLLTAWPAFTEAMYLLSFSSLAQDALWELVLEEAMILVPIEKDDRLRMQKLMRKYRDLPMDLADAALVCVAERERIRRIFTLDRKHFSVYRPSGVGRFEIFP